MVAMLSSPEHLTIITAFSFFCLLVYIWLDFINQPYSLEPGQKAELAAQRSARPQLKSSHPVFTVDEARLAA